MACRELRVLPLTAVVMLSACGGGGGGSSTPSTGAPPIITQSYTFPAGHATAAAGDTAWDIVGVSTTLSGQFGGGAGNAYDTLRVDVTFVQDISHALPAPGQPLSSGTQLGVHVAIDQDGNSDTGIFGGCNITAAITPFSYVTDQGNFPTRLSDGNYTIIGPNGAIYSGASNPPAEAVTSVATHVFSQSFFLPALNIAGGTSIPRIGINVASFNGRSSTSTDCVPNGSAIELYTTGI